VSAETRALTDYERGLLEPALQAVRRAQDALQLQITLLGGEAWRDAGFDLDRMMFKRPPGAVPSPVPAAEPAMRLLDDQPPEP
jgi:hypothetical protein